MSLERGRCLLSLVIVTGFLLGTSCGQNGTTVGPTTTEAPTTMPPTTLDVNYCAQNPCENGGTCVDGSNNYTCRCAPGYSGENCQTDIDDCASNPCQNGGTCEDEIDDYTCECAPGFSGTNCGTDINECMNNECKNGATCNDLVNGYNCTCPVGFNGTFCEYDINACDPNPCENAGNCTNHPMSTGDATYTCYCLAGWTGTNCAEDIRECESTPCENGGTCNDGTNFYSCTCAPGYNGTYCENRCPTGTFGYYCMEDCKCVASANCSHVDGSCTCDQEICDKRELQVIASRATEGPIMQGDRFTLTCLVNLVGEDLDEVSWYRNDMKLPSTSDAEYEINNDTDVGEYNITVRNAGPEDTGNYKCTAVTTGNQFTNSSEIIVISVIVRGTIDRTLSKLNDSIQLNQTASLNCTVFSSSNASIVWKRMGERLEHGVNRTSIQDEKQEGTGGIFFFSYLQISNIVREDNGIYICVALDGEENATETDMADFNIYVLEVAELANARYIDVRSQQLSLVWDFTVQGNADLDCTANYTIQGTNVMEQQSIGGSPPGMVTGLNPFTLYEFNVTCVNLVGSSEPLVYPSVMTLAGKPSIPRNVAVSDRQAQQVLVSWEKPEEPNGPIDRYYVIANTGEPSGPKMASFNGNTTSGILGELTAATHYALTVQAVNFNVPEGDQKSDPGPDPDGFGFLTPEDVPGMPFNLRTNDGTDICTVMWDQPRKPNGRLIRYTLYTGVYRSDTQNFDQSLEKRELEPTREQYEFMKNQLPTYSIFRFYVTASTEVGEGENATTSGTCTTPPGVPVSPPILTTPDESEISQTSFTTTLPSYDERNGPVSCYEVIVVELGSVEVGQTLDSSAPDYGPSRTRSHEEAMENQGTPYRAMVFRNRPSNNKLVIGATTEDITTCNTGGGPGSGRRRRRETTTASELTAVNGPLNTGGIYSTFIRVYTPSTAQGMVFYESGPFMAPVTLNQKPPNVGGIVGGVMSALIAVCFVVIMAFWVTRRKRQKEHGDPLMTPTSNGPRENGNGTLIGMANLGIEDDMVVKPIKLENLEKAIREKAKDEKKQFWDEYKALPNRPPPMVTMNSSNHPANKDKNRYINIIAYDHTRVKLKHVDGIDGSDYINASYVNGYQSPDKFIAAQGPKDNTLEDFWRMIWECNCSTIVMLTKCVEDGKDKCSQYWPNSGSIKYGKFEVKLDVVKETAEYVIRSFFLSEHGKDSGQRSITQFHFLGWPDHGQPDYPSPMLCLIKRVRHLTSKMNHRANIVVHCSAGVGRTGTYIVIDAMLDMMKHEKQVDIYNFIHEIRQQRNTLVQSFVQYFFIHIALLEEHLFGHMDIGMSDFPSYYQQLSNKSELNEDLTKLEEEFRRACKLGVNGTEQTYANIDQNKDKNRIGHILPFDKNIVKLERLIGEEFSDYINASYITGYERKNMYIATQGPLPNTITDFWRMIWESQTSTIVMLTETTEKGHEMCAQYWPLEVDEVEEHGDISVTLINESDDDDAFTVRDIEISHAHMKDIRKIRQFHFRGWPEVGVPDTGIDLMRLVNKSHLHQKENGAHPIVVHCSAGAGRTGVFIALNVLMSRMEEESMVDVFQTVRGLRQQRPHMVQDLAQYKFCYLAMVEYIQDQSTEYQNYVPRV